MLVSESCRLITRSVCPKRFEWSSTEITFGRPGVPHRAARAFAGQVQRKEQCRPVILNVGLPSTKAPPGASVQPKAIRRFCGSSHAKSLWSRGVPERRDNLARFQRELFKMTFASSNPPSPGRQSSLNRRSPVAVGDRRAPGPLVRYRAGRPASPTIQGSKGCSTSARSVAQRGPLISCFRIGTPRRGVPKWSPSVLSGSRCFVLSLSTSSPSLDPVRRAWRP